MKSLRVTLVIIAALSIMMSCGGDDLVKLNDNLTGEWTAISFSADISSEVGSGADMTATQTNVAGSNFDYNLTFTENDWNTSGGYDTEISIISSEFNTAPITASEKGITGTGSYVTENDSIIIKGSMFEYDMSSMGMTSINNEDQTATYNINSDGELILTHDETTTTSMNGISINTSIKSTSTWVRK